MPKEESSKAQEDIINNEQPCNDSPNELLPEDDFKSDEYDVFENSDFTQDLTNQLLLEKLEGMEKKFDALTDGFQSLEQAITDFQQSIKVVDILGEQNKKLNDNFYQKHVLHPTLMNIIGLADRCRENIGKWNSTLKACVKVQDNKHHGFIRRLINERNSDLIDIENALANLGVCPFHHHHEKFDPSQQQVLKKVPHSAKTRHMQIAVRNRPGYKLNEIVIRREGVSVFVLQKDNSI